MSDRVKPAIVEEALRRLRISKEFFDKQRLREREALKFQVPELQWDEDMKKSRQACVIDGVQVQARPMISIPKLNQPIQLVLNQQNAAHLGVNVSPLSEEATDDTAEVIRDLYRREEQRSNAGQVRSWAFDRCVKSGMGWYAIDTAYDEESNNPFDQRVIWRRILYQDSVYPDPSAVNPDFSDGAWAHELAWMRVSRLRREFPNAELAKLDDPGLLELASDEPDWVKIGDANEEPAILVDNYWRKEYKKRTWVILDDGSFSYEDEIPDGRSLHPDPKVSKRRDVQVPTVYHSVLTSTEALNEPEEWNGQHIPLIPTIGVELQPFDDERRWQGIIEPAMGAQRLFNHAASNAVELAALEPKAPYTMYDGQTEGYETMWQQANIRNFPFLLVNRDAKGPNGEMLPLPVRTQTDTGKLTSSMLLLDKADQFIQASTTTLDQTRIEQMGRRRVAHQTIQSLQEQADLGNSHYLHNLATVSMPYEARVVIDLLAALYDRPGRIARLLDGEDNERTVMLNQPFTMDPNTKRPMPAQEGQQGSHVKHYDLKAGRYGVSVSIGKSWQDRLQQGANEIGDILTSDPALMPLIGPTYFKFRDFPGAKEIAELLKKVRAKQFPGLDEDENDPQAAQQQVEAMKGQMQQMQAQLAEAADMIKTEKVKVQGEITKATIAAKTQVAIHRMDNAAKMAVAQINAEAKGLIMTTEAHNEAEALAEQQTHERTQNAADRYHELNMAQLEHERAMEQAEQQAQFGAMSAEQGQAHALQQGEQGHEQALEQGQQAADLAPKPEEGAGA